MKYLKIGSPEYKKVIKRSRKMVHDFENDEFVAQGIFRKNVYRLLR